MINKPLVAAICVLVIGLMIAFGQEFTTSGIRYSSSLRAAIDRHSPEPTIRNAILTLIPIGSPRLTVEKAIKTHFSGSPRRTADLPDAILAGYRDSPQICIRLFHHDDIPSGSDWVEAIFVFDADSKLKDLIVGKYGVYL